LIALAYYFEAETGRFFQDRNLRNVAQQNVHILIVAVGMTLVMLSGGIDLSVGSIAALGVARGLTLLYTNNEPISIVEIDQYTYWRRESFNLPVVGETPVSVSIAVIVIVLAVLLLTRTRYGLHIYAVGGNEETARLAGVSVNRVKLLTYALSGMLAALAGIILTARVYSAQPRNGVGLELEAIASAVLGGISLFGGVGNIPGAVIGALLVGILGNGMNLMRVESYQQDMIKGIVLVLAVMIDMYTKRFENNK
jgi:ribose transport system permease protein